MNGLKVGRCVTLLPLSFSPEELGQTIHQARLTAARERFPDMNLLKPDHYDVGRHLVMATPLAFIKLDSNVELLQRLQLGLRADNLDEAALKSAGFAVRRFGNHGSFGLWLNNGTGQDATLFESSYTGTPAEPGLVTDPGLCRPFFRAFGIEIANASSLTTPEQVRNLHQLLQFSIGDRNYSATRSVTVEPGNYNRIFALGTGNYIISQAILTRHVQSGPWLRITHLPLVGAAINAGIIPELNEPSGLFHRPELMSRLLLLSPAAFFALSRSDDLLERLGNYLLQTDRLDCQTLRNFRIKQEDGREPAHFVLDQKLGDRYLGLCLNYPDDIRAYRFSRDTLGRSEYWRDIRLYFIYEGIVVNGEKELSPADWLNLRSKYRSEAQILASVTVSNDQPVHTYSPTPNGKMDAVYSRALLEKERTGVN
jgi:hypothetical protein